MTISTAHSILEDKQRIMTHYPYVFTDTDREVNGMAILAIEKQIPMEHHHTRISENPFIVRESVCPYCLGVIVSQKDEYPKYCEWCGQAIDWSPYEPYKERE